MLDNVLLNLLGLAVAYNNKSLYKLNGQLYSTDAVRGCSTKIFGCGYFCSPNWPLAQLLPAPPPSLEIKTFSGLYNLASGQLRTCRILSKMFNYNCVVHMFYTHV